MLALFEKLYILVKTESFTMKKVLLTVRQVRRDFAYTSALKRERTSSFLLRCYTFPEFGIISVKNVAFFTGFSDSLYFSNTFKKAIGVSPKEFIKRLSESNAQKTTLESVVFDISEYMTTGKKGLGLLAF